MAVKQTVVKKANAIRFGSGKFEVSDDNWASAKDLGAMRNIIFEETWDELIVKSDNAGDVLAGIRNQKAALVGDLMEFDLEKLDLVRGQIDDYTAPDGTPITGAEQTVLAGTWAYLTFIPFEHQNADKTVIVVTSVTPTTPPALVEKEGYDIVSVGGVWGITITEATGIPALTDNIVIVYDYTPATHKLLKSGGLFTMTAIQARVTNINEAGKNFIITLFKANSASGITIALQPDEGEDAAVCPIRIQGTCDPALTEGMQLFQIEDYQNVE